MKNQQAEDIRILKTIWRKDEAGIWASHDLKGIDLKPRKGFTRDYFKIENEINLMTQSPGPIMNNVFASFGTTEFLVRQSIVPIVAWNDGDEEMRCIGTGFFVSASGLLLTAAHVIRDPIDENYASPTEIDKNSHRFGEDLRYGVLLPANPAMRDAPFLKPSPIRDAKWFMCPFERAQHWGREVESPLLHQDPEFKLDHDIAVCKVKEQPLVGPYQPLNIGLYNLKINDRAVAIGYPEMRNVRFVDDDYQPELIVSVGSVTAIYPDNVTDKKNSTDGPNFEFNAKIPGKMSGSPILVGGGIITKGVVSRSFGSDENHASGCLIASMMNFRVIDKESLIDLMKNETMELPNFPEQTFSSDVCYGEVIIISTKNLMAMLGWAARSTRPSWCRSRNRGQSAATGRGRFSTGSVKYTCVSGGAWLRMVVQLAVSRTVEARSVLIPTLSGWVPSVSSVGRCAWRSSGVRDLEATFASAGSAMPMWDVTKACAC